MSSDPKFTFPETLAAMAMLLVMGYSNDDLYYVPSINPITKKRCMGIEVRPQEARGITRWMGKSYTISLDEIDPTLNKDPTKVVELLNKDVAAWNKTSNEFRSDFVEKSHVRSAAVEISAALAVRNIRPEKRRVN